MDELLNFSENKLQVVVFKLGNEEYAIPVNLVQEVIIQRKSTRIPKSKSYVEGMINLRGHIIPVIDARKMFRITKAENLSKNDERIILLDLEEEKIGLVVDKVSEVVNLNTGNIESPPINVEENVEFISGVARHGESLLILINPQKFFDDLESGNIKDFARNIKNFTKVTDSIKQAVNENV